MGTNVERRCSEDSPDTKHDEEGGLGYVAIAGNPISNDENCTGDKAIDARQRDGEVNPYPNGEIGVKSRDDGKEDRYKEQGLCLIEYTNQPTAHKSCHDDKIDDYFRMVRTCLVRGSQMRLCLLEKSVDKACHNRKSVVGC